MSGEDLWKKYCSFYEKPFHEQLEFNENRMKRYFKKWKKTDLAKMFCKPDIQSHKDVPISSYSDYSMLSEFGSKIEQVTQENPRKQDELFWQYYLRVSAHVGAPLERYMTEPYYFCSKTTGTTGASKWVVMGETFWKNYLRVAIGVGVISGSDSWGETKIKEDDTALNITAPVPYTSGWGARAFQTHFNLLPPLEMTDNLQDMKKKFHIVLKAIEKGKKIDMAGGIGSMFFIVCKYFVDPEEFYGEYYNSMSFSLKKILFLFKLLQCKLSTRQKKSVRDYLPLKGVIIGGMDAQLYIDFFKKEYNLEPLHAYGSTEVGNLMNGDPDRKTYLIPHLTTSYLEFKTKEGQIKRLHELKRGETYDLVITPFESILFRYDMEDLFRVIDFRDDGMPVFAFEGRKKSILDLYGYYRVTPYIIVQTLDKAGLKTSDRWAVTKLLEPKEHLCFLMEKTWSYSEEQAEKVIFNALKETLEDFGKYVADFHIENPSEADRVEYLKQGAFMRYSGIKAKMGSPMGQIKPPQLIPADRMEIYETLRNA